MTAPRPAPAASTTFEQIRRLRLVTPSPDGQEVVTAFRVPTLAEALAWADGRAVFLLDVKSDVPLAELVAALRQADAADRAAVITYSLADHERLFSLAPDLVVSATAESRADLDALFASPVDLDRVIAWTGVGVPDPSVVARLHQAGIRAQAGAFGSIDEAARTTASPAPYDPILATGADVLSTDVVPMAALAARNATLIGRARR